MSPFHPGPLPPTPRSQPVRNTSGASALPGRPVPPIGKRPQPAPPPDDDDDDVGTLYSTTGTL